MLCIIFNRQKQSYKLRAFLCSAIVDLTAHINNLVLLFVPNKTGNIKTLPVLQEKS